MYKRIVSSFNLIKLCDLLLSIMSTKKNTLNTSGNTLFNYFARSPSTPKSNQATASPAASPFAAKPATPTSSKMGKSGMYTCCFSIIFYNHSIDIVLIYNFILIYSVRKSVQDTFSSAKKLKNENGAKNDLDDDEEVVVKKGKRKISCLDSDSDYENDENESENSQDDVPRKQSAGKKIKLEPNKKKVKSIEERLKASKDDTESPMDIDDSSNDAADFGDGLIVHKHHNIDFLKPDKIRDAQNRRPDDPKYDPTTVYIPKNFLDEQTPVCIVFF